MHTDLTLYFNNAGELAGHMEQLLISFVASPFFNGLSPAERSTFIVRHLALMAHCRHVWH